MEPIILAEIIRQNKNYRESFHTCMYVCTYFYEALYIDKIQFYALTHIVLISLLNVT